MKKLMTIALGLGLVLGSLSFAQPADKSTTKSTKKAKSTSSKTTKAKTKSTAKM